MNYDTLKIIHTLAAYVWLGSLFGSLIFATVTTRRSANGVLTGAVAVVRFATRVGLPAAVVLLIAGIWMVAAYNVGSGMWINIGFILWLVAAVVGSALMHPAARKMRNAATDDEAIAYAKRIIWVGGGEIVAVAIAIWVMGAQLGS
ncbi:MAG: DUF2269 family protein [Gaiellales bacterium]